MRTPELAGSSHNVFGCDPAKRQIDGSKHIGFLVLMSIRATVVVDQRVIVSEVCLLLEPDRNVF